MKFYLLNVKKKKEESFCHWHWTNLEQGSKSNEI